MQEVKGNMVVPLLSPKGPSPMSWSSPEFSGSPSPASISPMRGSRLSAGVGGRPTWVVRGVGRPSSWFRFSFFIFFLLFSQI
jgi:hypothetical protein